MTTREWDTMSRLFRLCDAIEKLPIQLRGQVYESEEINEAYKSAKVQLKLYKDEIRTQLTSAVAESEINHRFNNITIHKE